MNWFRMQLGGKRSLLTMPKRPERCGAMAGFAIMIRWLVNGRRSKMPCTLRRCFAAWLTGDQLEQLRPFLSQPPMHSSGWAPLSWPPVVMTLIGAAAAAHMPMDAAELAFRYIDGSYRSTDRRELDEHGGLPGVTREYRRSVSVGKWGQIEYVNAGIEGYGWGALSVFLLIRYVMGLREEEQGVLSVAPVMPQALRRQGASYKIASVQWGTYALGVECVVKDINSFIMRLSCLSEEGQSVQQWEWEGKWGEERKIILVVSPDWY